MTREARDELLQKLKAGPLDAGDPLVVPVELVVEVLEDARDAEDELQVVRDELREANEELATWRRTYQ